MRKGVFHFHKRWHLQLFDNIRGMIITEASSRQFSAEEVINTVGIIWN